MRKSWILGSLAALGVILGSIPVAEGQPLRIVAASGVSDPELEHSNGDKIVRGRWNQLHAVYQRFGQVLYVTSSNGQTWSSPVTVGFGTLPAVAADHGGTVAVAFVANNTLFYAYRTFNQTSFTTVALAAGAQEVAIVARNAQVHLAWSTGNRVRYATFPTSSPPSQLTLATETIAQTSCPNTSYSRPAITLVGQPCTTYHIPVVGYLFASAEQTNSTPSCQKAYTEVGPRVAERQLPSGWLQTFDGVRQDAIANGTVLPVSLSLSGDFVARDVFLAWSDQQNNSARTVLAKGRPGNFQTATLDAQRRHVHVRAANDALQPRGRFRLAWIGGSLLSSNPFPFQEWDSFERDGSWTGAGSLSWTTSPLRLSGIGGALAGRTQALFWERLDPVTCQLQQQETAFYEIEVAYAQEKLVTYEPPLAAWPVRRMDSWACPPRSGGGGPPTVAIARRAAAPDSDPALPATTWVDLEEVGRLGEIREDGLDFETFDGELVAVHWAAGTKLVTAWPGGFVIDGPPEAVEFSGAVDSFEVVDYGELPSELSGPPVCDPDLGECPDGP